MHGCPSNEIESIGKYLIEEKRLHTFVKLNPTLLGKSKVREILNQKLGYERLFQTLLLNMILIMNQQ